MKFEINTIEGIEENIMAVIRKSLIKFSKRWAPIGLGVSNNGIKFSLTDKLPNSTTSPMDMALNVGTSDTWVNISVNETPEKFMGVVNSNGVWTVSKSFKNVKSISLNDFDNIFIGHKTNTVLINFSTETSISVDLKLIMVEKPIDSSESINLISSQNIQAISACSYGIYPRFSLGKGCLTIDWDIPECFEESVKNILQNVQNNAIKIS